VKIIGLVFLLLACTRVGNRPDTISISVPSDISTLDPANCFDTVCYVPLSQVYESLYELEYLKRPYTLRPLLAEGMPQISKDRLTYIFKIKKNIKYHPSELIPKGRVVSSQDFIDQIKRLAFLGTRSQGWWLFDGKIKGLNEWRDKVSTDFSKFFNESVEGLRAPDKNTLIIELNRPYPQLLYALAMNFTSPIPAEAIRATQNDFTNHFTGTGPYIITHYNPAQEVGLIKNPDYTSSVYPNQGDRYSHEKGLLKDAGAKLPFIDKARIQVIKEAQTDWLNFLKKKIDIINLTKDHYALALTSEGKLRQEILNDKIALQASPTLIYWWISFNMKDPIVGKNLDLRKAIAHAVNIDEFIELFTYNIAQRANSIYPPGIPGYSPSNDTPYRYDMDKAKEYLARAGYPDGKGLPTLIYDVRGNDSRRRQMGEFVQKELAAIGIKTEVRMNSFPIFLEKSRKGELQFWQGGWVMDYPDSENVLQLLSSDNLPPGPNSSQFVNKEYDELFMRLRGLEDGPEKFNLMKRMEDIVHRELPWIMQYYSRNYILVQPYLGNFRYSDIVYNYIKYLRLKKP